MLALDAKTRKLLKDAQDYLRVTLGVHSRLKVWDAENGLPLFLRNGFDFRQTELLGHSILLSVPIDDSVNNPADLLKRAGSLQRHFEGIIVLVLARLSTYQRSRLIENSANFMVPGNQLFIPQLATDLRERHRRRHGFTGDRFPPMAQALLLRHLNLKDVEDARPIDLAQTLRYSAMSIGRAFEAIEASGLCRIEQRGRGKHIRFFSTPLDLFEAASPRLRSPVKSVHWFRARSLQNGIHDSPKPRNLPIGGESALSERSIMSRPRIVHYAAGQRDWKRLQKDNLLKMVAPGEGPNFTVYVWWYDPDIVSGAREVDALSLYLQYRDHPNERLQAAAEQLLERFAW